MSVSLSCNTFSIDTPALSHRTLINSGRLIIHEAGRIFLNNVIAGHRWQFRLGAGNGGGSEERRGERRRWQSGTQR